MQEKYIPKRTEMFGDFEFSKFIDNDDIYDEYMNTLIDLAELANDKGHHEISDILDTLSFTIQASRYREFHSYIKPYLQKIQLEEFYSQN